MTSVKSCPSQKPNKLGPNESHTLEFHILANEVQGIGTINLSMMPECDDLNTSVLNIPINVNVDKNTSTQFTGFDKTINIH